MSYSSWQHPTFAGPRELAHLYFPDGTFANLSKNSTKLLTNTFQVTVMRYMSYSSIFMELRECAYLYFPVGPRGRKLRPNSVEWKNFIYI